jgi:hypothetical protein
LVAYSKMGRIRSVVTRRFTLEQANEALENLKAGKIIDVLCSVLENGKAKSSQPGPFLLGISLKP